MCTVLTACSAVRYSTAAVRIVTVFIQILLKVVFYGTGIAAVRIVTVCVQFLQLVVFYGTVLQQ